MTIRPFQQIDVFTHRPGDGNPVAVVFDAHDLADADMQRFARWTNLSETTFVLPPTAQARAAGADYRVRIFTPGGELPFAGHPTLGTCHAWLAAGGQPQAGDTIVQECVKGLIAIRRDGERLAFAAPALQASAPGPALLAQTAKALGLQAAQIIKAQQLDNGPQWLALWLDSADTVLALAPDQAALQRLGHKVGVAGLHGEQGAQGMVGLVARSSREARAFAASEPAPLIEVRAFAAPVGVVEDPVTGSLNASLAQWLIAAGDLPPRYVAAQGTALGRAGRVHIEQIGDVVWVGGGSVTCIDGMVRL